MPTSSDAYAVDTSVAVAAVDAAHAAHVPCRDAVDRLRPALAGHAAVETYSVLTRMPGVMAVDTSVAAEILARVFPTAVWLGSDDAERLRARLAAIGIMGGAGYDALVGEAARVNGRRLHTRDRRALSTYVLLGVDHELVGP